MKMNDDRLLVRSINLDPDDLFDWRNRHAELEEAGYRPGFPGDAADVDGQIARSCICPMCDRPMEYRPMMRPGDAYYAFAVCVPCDRSMEF